jgi:hypothetical protein
MPSSFMEEKNDLSDQIPESGGALRLNIFWTQMGN